MKKFILTAAVFALFTSCTKEKETIEETSEKKESSEIVPETTDVNSFQLKELSTANMVSYLADKQNDTLYVTNFFATWCGPCMKEIPHFIDKKNELKDQPVKFTFVSIDAKEDWDTKVKEFAAENSLEKNIVLLDGQKLDAPFFTDNFTTWDGSGIPFTIIKKGNKREEIFGFTSAETLNEKINSLK